MNTSWSSGLKECYVWRAVGYDILVGLAGDAPVIVQGYIGILLRQFQRERTAKKGGNTMSRPFVSDKGAFLLNRKLLES